MSNGVDDLPFLYGKFLIAPLLDKGKVSLIEMILPPICSALIDERRREERGNFYPMEGSYGWRGEEGLGRLE